MMSWQQITVRKPRPGVPKSLGQRAHDSAGRPRAFSDAERRQLMREVKHSLCVEHVRVQGYRQAVCIVKGQQRDDVLREAYELLRVRRSRGSQRRVLWLAS